MPVDVLRGALDTPEGEEPRELRERVKVVVDATGMYSSVRGYTPLGQVWSDLTYQWEPSGEPMADMEPGPSPLRHSAARLAKYLTQMNATDVASLPEVSPPAGPVTIPVTGWVRVVSPDASLPVQCGTCRATAGGSVALDGPLALFVCPTGHCTDDPKLEASRVRYALRYQALPDDEGDKGFRLADLATQSVEESLRFLGLADVDTPQPEQRDLLVASTRIAPNTDPRRLSPADRG
ncbi:hypothetical protein [Streptomyces sp. x-19]|uniref:hypothetical protein n=1 Tax=Streptomyces sp. x-19 TaxID=2789280 RepID=UPI00397F01FF